MVIEAYGRCPTDLPLVIVGDAPYASRLHRRLHATTDPRVRFTGAIYGAGYQVLRSHATAYVQATEVGGTHPALVEAMGTGNAIVANDVPEHRETLGEAGRYYRGADGLAAELTRGAHDDVRADTMRSAARGLEPAACTAGTPSPRPTNVASVPGDLTSRAWATGAHLYSAGAPTALITGITGQDGSYLAELLLDEGYRVVGMTRRSSTADDERIAHLAGRLELVQGDLLDQASLVSALAARLQPDEVYNLAAQSFVPTSWNQPVLTGEFTGARRHAAARGDPPGRPDDPLLPGVVERDVRQGPRGPAERDRRRSTRAARTASPRRTAIS